MRANEYRKYELLACVKIIQRESCMSINGYRKSAVRAVGMCQHYATRGLRVAHEYHEYERWYVSASRGLYVRE